MVLEVRTLLKILTALFWVVERQELSQSNCGWPVCCCWVLFLGWQPLWTKATQPCRCAVLLRELYGQHSYRAPYSAIATLAPYFILSCRNNSFAAILPFCPVHLFPSPSSLSVCLRCARALHTIQKFSPTPRCQTSMLRFTCYSVFLYSASVLGTALDEFIVLCLSAAMCTESSAQSNQFSKVEHWTFENWLEACEVVWINCLVWNSSLLFDSFASCVFVSSSIFSYLSIWFSVIEYVLTGHCQTVDSFSELVFFLLHFSVCSNTGMVCRQIPSSVLL